MEEKYSARELLDMLLEAIDYSFLKTDGSYDKSLTYPVIDKVRYIKDSLIEKDTTTPEEERMLLDLNSTLVKFWIGKGRPKKEVKARLLRRMLNWYKKSGTIVQD